MSFIIGPSTCTCKTKPCRCGQLCLSCKGLHCLLPCEVLEINNEPDLSRVHSEPFAKAVASNRSSRPHCLASQAACHTFLRVRESCCLLSGEHIGDPAWPSITQISSCAGSSLGLVRIQQAALLLLRETCTATHTFYVPCLQPSGGCVRNVSAEGRGPLSLKC